MPTEFSVVAATRAPVTRDRLLADLGRLGIAGGSVLIAHVSMSALGWVAGGAQTVVEALLAAVGDNGTLVMPAQSSQLADPINWSNPPVPPAWFDTIRADMPAFDPALTPTRGIGVVAECFRHHPDTRRSPHPIASFTARGPRAADIVAEHPLTPMLGGSSPLGRLYELDASVLLLGVGHDSNTSLHLAEYRADWPSRHRRQDGAPVLENGTRQWRAWEDLDLSDEDFAQIGDAFAASGQEQTGRVGEGTGRLMRQRAIIDFAVDWMNRNRA